MKFKNILIVFSIFIVLSISLSAVSATDDYVLNDDNENSIDIISDYDNSSVSTLNSISNSDSKLNTSIVSVYNGNDSFVGKYNKPMDVKFIITDQNGDPVNGGNVTLNTKQGKYYAEVINGEATFNNLTFNYTGSCSCIIEYNAFGNYLYSLNKTCFNIISQSTNINATIIVTENNSALLINVYDEEGNYVNKGNLTCTDSISSTSQTFNVTGSPIVFNIPSDFVGEYSTFIQYLNDLSKPLPCYYSSSINFKGYVKLITKTDVDVNDSGVYPSFSVYVKDINNNTVNGGKVNLYIDDMFIESKDVVNSLAYYEYKYLNVGEHTVLAVYEGSQNYTNSSVFKEFTIDKAEPTVVVNVENISYKEIPIFSANVTGIRNETLDNSSVEFTVFNEDGVDVTSQLDKLSVGNYTVVATYMGNENYTFGQANNTFTVSKLNATLYLTKSGYYYKSTTLIATLINPKTGEGVSNENITFKISKYSATVTTNGSGIATYVIPYAPATYAVSANASNENIDSNVPNLSVKISKATATIYTYALTTTYASGAYFQVKVLGKDKKPLVGLKLALKVYTGSKYKTVYVTTNSNGIAKYSGSTLSIGKHKVIVSSAESTKYVTATAKTNYITVKKGITTVVAPTVTNKYKQTAYFKATVTNKASGKVISGLSLKVKVYTGSKYTTYTIKTNSKGVAYLNTKSLKKGTHKVIITSGSSYYTVSKTSYIKIV